MYVEKKSENAHLLKIPLSFTFRFYYEFKKKSEEEKCFVWASFDAMVKIKIIIILLT